VRDEREIHREREEEKQDEPHPRATTCRSVPARPVVSPRSSPIAPGRRRQPTTASLTRDNRRSRASHLQEGRPSPPRCAPASSSSPGRPAQLRLPPPPARRRRRHTGRRRQPTTAPSTRDAQQPPFPAPAQPHRTAASSSRLCSPPASTRARLRREEETRGLGASRSRVFTAPHARRRKKMTRTSGRGCLRPVARTHNWSHKSLARLDKQKVIK
jgi:hypothetical protein